MSGAFEAIVDVGSSLISDIGSVVTDFGTEFASSLGGLDFGISLDSIADFGAFEQIGSFAGNATWFDAFNPGDIISSVSSVAESGSGFLSSFSLPSLSDIKSIASTVQSDFGGFIRDAQSAIQTAQKFAPIVNVASSALGIPNPINEIIQPLGQAVGIAGAAAGVAGGVATGNVRSVITSPAVVSTAASFIGGAESAQLARGIGTGVSLYNTVQDLGSRLPLGEATAVSGPTGFTVAGAVSQIAALSPELQETTNGVVGGTFRELTAAETRQLENIITPGLINRLTDPGIPQDVVTNAVTNLISAPADQASTAINQFLSFYEPESGTWSVFDTINNTTVQSGLTEQQARVAENEYNIIVNGATLNSDTTANDDPFEQARLFAEERFNAPAPTEADILTAANSRTQALATEARNQQELRNQRNTKAQSKDWRVRLSLAPNSNYLYKDSQPGLLAPLKDTNGVIFPYTPTIETAYKANYDSYDLTHSNYRGYFYKNSYVDAVNLRATFTAQDTNEANYLLAVIHFFRSVTKMFYGQNTDQRGAPPPLVYIKGYGDFQFNNHPCLVSQFNYTLPPDVDYIRAQSVLSNNTNLQLARLRSTIANNPLAYSVNRLLNSQLLPGALDFRPQITNNLGIGNPTYVPTKIEISVSLLPIQSRQQISKNFSFGGFANGNQLSGGFW